jgi:hypothetical protein
MRYSVVQQEATTPSCRFSREARRVWPLLFVMFAALPGCGTKGPELAPVKGKVTLDGRPMTHGHVGTIPPVGRGAHGDIQSDGTFELHTYAKGDGARVGAHKVGVAAYDASAPRGPESEYGKLLVPKHYTNPESSGLTIDVSADGLENVELKLSTAPAAK